MTAKYGLALILCSVAFAQYGGPQILTPGGSHLVGTRAGRAAGFRYYAGARGSAETGLLQASVDSEGNLVDAKTVYGGIFNAGAYGQKAWRRTIVGLNVNGQYRYYPSAGYYQGANATLALNVQQQLTKRTAIAFTNVGGTLAQAFGGLYGYVDNPDQVVGVPVNNIFDNRTYFWQTGGNATYEKSARLSFSVGGMGFFIRPESPILVRTNGYGAQGNMAYRLSRRTAVILSYNFYHFDYPQAFGESDAHILLLGVERQFSRRWTGTLAAGASQTSTVNVTQIPADPITQALFGISKITRVLATTKRYPAVQLALNGTFRRSGLSFTFTERPNPGNGVYLTSNSKTASASYSYVATRRASFSLGLTYSDLNSVGQRGLGQYWTVSGDTGMAYRLTESLHFTASVHARRYHVGAQTGTSRLGYGADIGLTFSPGEVPLSFW